MKSKDIAICGLMIAIYVVISFVFIADVRFVQTFIEVVKTAVIAVCIRKFSSHKNSIIFLFACYMVCLITLPINQTIIHGVPCLIGGYVIGIQKERFKVRGFFMFFFINTLMIVYEFLLYNAIMGINLFSTYKNGLTDILTEVLGINISSVFLSIFFVLLVLVDSVFSSVIIYVFSSYVIKQTDKLIK